MNNIEAVLPEDATEAILATSETQTWSHPSLPYCDLHRVQVKGSGTVTVVAINEAGTEQELVSAMAAGYDTYVYRGAVSLKFTETGTDAATMSVSSYK